MAKYRIKPRVVDAFRWTGDEHQIEDPDWACEAMRDGRITVGEGGTPYAFLIVSTPTGGRVVDRGDWIIQDMNGAIYPCLPETFAANYEEIL